MSNDEFITYYLNEKQKKISDDALKVFLEYLYKSGDVDYREFRKEVSSIFNDSIVGTKEEQKQKTYEIVMLLKRVRAYDKTRDFIERNFVVGIATSDKQGDYKVEVREEALFEFLNTDNWGRGILSMESFLDFLDCIRDKIKDKALKRRIDELYTIYSS